MIFDADGATFHPLGRPRVRLGWGEFSMEVRWHESITVRHGRTKRRFLVAYLDTTTPRIVALANPRLHGRRHDRQEVRPWTR